jgi:hypothetical protein
VPITTNSIVRTAANAVSCDLDGEAAILNVQSGEYYGLDEIGASVWWMMNQPCTLAAIIQQILTEYEVDADRCEKDLISLISKLAEHGLVEINDSI